MGGDTGEWKKEYKMKKLFITLGRERDLIRYSEKSDLKDAKEISEEDAVSLLRKTFILKKKPESSFKV